MKIDIYFTQPKLINGVARLCYSLDNIIGCLKKDGYIYFVGINCYQRFNIKKILYCDLGV